MRLWLRFALVIAAVSVFSLLFLGVWAQQVTGQSATEAAEKAQERDAIAVAASVGRWLDGQTDFLVGWVGAFAVSNMDASRQTGLLRAILTAMPSTVTVVLVDGDGQPVVQPVFMENSAGVDGVSVVGSEARAGALIRRLPVTEALANPSGMAFGSIHRFDGETYSVPVAVVASENPPLVLGAEIRLVVAAELDAQSTADRAVLLVDRAGTVVGRPNPLVDVSLLKPVLGTLASVSYGAAGTTVQGAVAPVGRTDWSVIVLEPAHIALQTAHDIRRLLVIVLMVAMAVAIALGFVMGRWFTEPIARLRDTALVLAEGRYGTRADVSSNDEVGELARAFNHLSERLKENQVEILRQRTEIEVFNQELQQRVDAATADLREAQESLVRSGQLAAVAQLGAGMAHELNNPLMAILGLAQVLRIKSTEPATVEVLGDLESQAERCRDVLDSLLKLTGAESGLGQEAAAGLQAVLSDARIALAGVVRDSGVTVEWGEVPDVRVAADAGLTIGVFGQILTALVLGLPEGALLSIRGEVDGGAVWVLMTPDQAVGIARDDWMAAGLDVWVARQTLDRLGGQLVEPVDESAAWRVKLPLG